MGYYFRSGYSIEDEQLEELSYKLAEQFVNEIDEKKKLQEAINQSVIEHQDVNTIIDIDKLKSLLDKGSKGLHSMEELIDKCIDEDGDVGLGLIGMSDEEKTLPPLDEEDSSETRFF